MPKGIPAATWERMTGLVVRAPFTLEQLYHLNKFQISFDVVRPLTCCLCGTNLHAVETRMVCPKKDCNYYQDWAYRFMVDGTMLASIPPGYKVVTTELTNQETAEIKANRQKIQEMVNSVSYVLDHKNNGYLNFLIKEVNSWVVPDGLTDDDWRMIQCLFKIGTIHTAVERLKAAGV